MRAVQFAMLPLTLLIVWDLSVRFGLLPRTLIATPVDVVQKFFIMLTDLRLSQHCFVSVRRLALGFALGTGTGIALGTVVGSSRTGARLCEPSVLSLIPTPPIAWIPLLIILFGIGEASSSSQPFWRSPEPRFSKASCFLLPFPVFYQACAWPLLCPGRCSSVAR